MLIGCIFLDRDQKLSKLLTIAPHFSKYADNLSRVSLLSNFQYQIINSFKKKVHRSLYYYFCWFRFYSDSFLVLHMYVFGFFFKASKSDEEEDYEKPDPGIHRITKHIIVGGRIGLVYCLH